MNAEKRYNKSTILRNVTIAVVALTITLFIAYSLFSSPHKTQDTAFIPVPVQVDMDKAKEGQKTSRRTDSAEFIEKPMSLEHAVLARHCRNIPRTEDAFSAFLEKAYRNQEPDAYIDSVAEQYVKCKSLPDIDHQYIKWLLVHAKRGDTEALRELWKVSDAEIIQHGKPSVSAETMKDKKAAFSLSKYEITEHAAWAGNEEAILILVKAYQHYDPKLGLPNYVKALAYVYWGNVNIQDNSLALRLSWYQDKLENGSTLDEAKMAREMAASFTLNHRG